MLRRFVTAVMVAALVLPGVPARAATGTIAPAPLHQFFNNSGAPCASCRVFTYTAGTSTKVSTYTDVGLTVAHSNPITLNSAGRPTSGIYLSPGVSYKFVLAPSGSDDPPASPTWTQDNVFSVPPSDIEMDITATAGEALVAGNVVALSDGTGGQTAGRWYMADADSAHLSTTANALGMMPADLASGSSGSVRLLGRVTGLSALTAGTVYYASATAGALTSSAPANARAVGVADSTTSIILSQWIPLPDASTTVAGKVSTGTQSFGGAKTFASALTLTAGFAAPPLGVPTFSRCTAALTKNADITPANITGLVFSVGANEVWTFQYVLKGTSGTTPDWRFAITGPAAPTAVWYGVMTSMDIPSGPVSVTAFATDVFAGGSGVEDTLIVHGLLRNGANAGTLQLQMAQLTSNASDTIIRAESFVLAWRIS